MAQYDIEIKQTGDFGTTASAAIIVAKALNLDALSIRCREGFFLSVSKDSRVVDIMNIYSLTVENKKLKENKKI